MIGVFICSSGGGEPRRECLEALGDASFTVVSEATMWQARRRALDECEADVLALLDGDVAVAGGWLERLEREWEAAPPEIAALGGPIRVPFARGRWEQAAHGGVDYGDAASVFDPLERTLFAGNLSFRVWPLRGVGGFRPPVDGRDGTDWLSEEHETQRQLGHWGWLGRYVPELAAERLQARGRARIAARRFRYGVRQGIARSRPPGAAARQALASAAGIAPALVLGRRAGALERAARAAENAGLVLAPLVARPAWRRFAADVDAGAAAADRPPPRAGRPPRERPAIALLYHRVAAPAADPLNLCVEPARFGEQLAVLAEDAEPIAMAELAAELRDGGPRPGTVAVTFDDGYRDNLTAALPLADRAGVPIALFAATGLIERGERFFWDEGQELILGCDEPRLSVTVEGKRHSWRTRRYDERVAAFRALHRLVQPRAPEVAQDVIAQLRAWSGRQGSTQLMSVDDVRAFARHPRAELGSHTRTHPKLTSVDAAAAHAEIAGSRSDIADWTGTAPCGFAYPFGLPRHDVDEQARRLVAEAGFDYAVVNQPVPVLRGSDPYAIPRYFAPDLGGDEFRAWLRALSC